MLEKLFRLGFSSAICTYSRDKTAEVMHREIDSNPELAARVLAELQDDGKPVEVTQVNYEGFRLQDWIQRHANGIHDEQTRAMLAPFKLMASLLFD